MICQQTMITRTDWSPATSYPFCPEHESLFGADDLNQCHAVRMAAAQLPKHTPVSYTHLTLPTTPYV